MNRRLRIALSIGGNGSGSAPSRATKSRQPQQSLMLESFEQQAALVIFEPAIGPLPIQPLTDRAGDFGDSQGCVIESGLAYEGQIIGGKAAPAKGDSHEVVHERAEELS